MKLKIFSTILLIIGLSCLSFAKNLSVTVIDDRLPGFSYDGNSVFELTDATLDSINDTLTPAAYNIYGPIPLTKKDCDPATYFQIYSGNNMLVAGDSAAIGYAITSTPTFADIIGYTITDTITGTTGKKLTAVATNALSGRYLFIKVLNVDETSIQLAKRIRVSVSYDCK